MLKAIDRGLWRVGVCVSASLMFGVMLAVWLRMLDAVAGRTAYSLAAGAGLAATGLAAGALAAGWTCRKGRPADLAFSVLLLALGCWLAVQLAWAPGIGAGWQRILNDLSRSVGQYGLALGKTGLLFVLIPSVLAGAAARVAWLSHAKLPASQPGQAFTLGVLLGVLPASAGYGLASAVLLPLAGAESVTRLAALWFGALASLAWARGVWSALPFAVVAGVLMTGVYPQGRASVLTDNVFSRLVHRDSGFARGTPVFSHRSRHHMVTAYDDPDYQFVFALDGRPLLFGNRFHTARTLTGYLPLLLRPECKKAAVLGPEAGLYLPFFVRAGVKDVAYGGADTAVVKLALSADGLVTGADVSAPAAVRRGAALSAKEAYDVVLLAAEPVWMRGTRRAYSRGLFKRCREALSADGLVALHLDARALSPRRFAAIARLFAQEFPAMQVWCTGPYDWLLVGGKQTLQVPADKMLGLVEKGAVVRDFARAGVLSLPEMLACLLCDGTGLAARHARPKGMVPDVGGERLF